MRALGWRALTVAVGLVLMGHSPYRQWFVYRQSHLVVVADGGAPGALAIGEAVAGALKEHVARSRAVAASARSAREVVSLVRSRQLQLAILLAADAADAARGQGAFAGQEPLAELRALAALGPYLLVALDDLPAGKAAEIARVVAEHAPGPLPAPSGAASVALHPALERGGASAAGCERPEAPGC